MSELIRPRPLCLILINGFSVDYLSNSDFKTFNFRRLANSYPFLILKSSDKNIDSIYDGYMEIGTGNYIKDLQENDERFDISLSQIISEAGLTQLHLSETEGYAHITYFFNNKNKKRHDREDWVKIRSPMVDFDFNNLDTMFDKINRRLIKEVDKQHYDFIVVSYNSLLTDSNDSKKIIKAIEILDKKIKNLVETILSYNGAVLITSSSSLIDSKPVPLFLINKFWRDKSFIDYNYEKEINKQKSSGHIYDIAPTILKIMGLSQPLSMNGVSLI